NFMSSPLHRVCDHFFCTSFPQTRVRSTALSAIPAQVCILDALYVLTARHRKSGRNVDRINRMIEERFRIRGKRR
ncbi:MAG: hypothetical protein PHR35_19240, partial [Kiritimatiellae bacterium]|nr:hypothetical protein [Kiritimatiellia bacterium]